MASNLPTKKNKEDTKKRIGLFKNADLNRDGLLSKKECRLCIENVLEIP